MTDVFAKARRFVSAQQAAEYYGFTPDRANFIPCPFHHEKTASLKLYPGDGGFYCFGCHTGGSVVDFVCKLFDLSPLDAVRRMNEDFRLGLPLDKTLDAETMKAAPHRQEINNTYRRFEQWRDEMVRRLNACFRLAHTTLQSLETPADLDQLTDAQVLAIREQPRFEWLADVLTSGSMREIMQIFRQRKEVETLCRKVLRNTPMKSGAA